MDVNLVFECIGYGASRAVASDSFQRSRHQVPARYILETTRDPVAYCIEAYSDSHPEDTLVLGTTERELILHRLEREAGMTQH